MMKYKNLSGRDIGFIVNGKTLDFQNGQIMEAPENFKADMAKVLDGIVPLEEPKQAPINAPAVASVKKYTHDELKALNKARQTSILNSQGVSNIPAKEEERISLIIKNQG